jgi:anti-sigma regulatory factor (Ser/Thr protein kinase)
MGSERFPTTMGGDGRTNGVTDGNVRTRHVDGIRPVERREADVRLTLPARPENVAVVRHVLGAFAEALRLPGPVVEDMRLAVTEACTNVVRHAYDERGEPGPLEIVIRPVGDMIDVIVSDRGRGLAPSPDRAGPGLGMSLIAALTHKLEVQQAAAGSRLAMSFLCRPALGAA